MNENYGILDRSIYILGIFFRNFFTKNIHILWKIQFDIVMHCKKRAENEKAISHRSRIIAFFFSTKPHWNVWVDLVHTYYLLVRRVNEVRVLGWRQVEQGFLYFFFCHIRFLFKEECIKDRRYRTLRNHQWRKASLNLSSTHFLGNQDFGLQV